MNIVFNERDVVIPVEAPAGVPHRQHCEHNQDEPVKDPGYVPPLLAQDGPVLLCGPLSCQHVGHEVFPVFLITHLSNIRHLEFWTFSHNM